jgi:hypothetical protein
LLSILSRYSFGQSATNFMKQHYILWYRLDENDRYLIWFSDKIDGVVVRNKQVVTFTSVAGLRSFATQNGIKLAPDEPVVHNFDTVTQWIPDPGQELNSIDCMNAWNLVKDVVNTLRMKFKGNLTDNLTLEVYDKICQNNTIPAHVPGAEGGKRNLKEKERKLLAEIMTQGLEIARRLL